MVKPDKLGIALAVRYLKDGKTVVYPTDTAYGLAVDATNLVAVRKLYRLKGRDFKKPMHVVVKSLGQAKKLVNFTPLAEKLFKKFLPGALTLVLSVKNNSPRPPLNLRGGALLSAGTGTLGLRMPKNQVALALVKKLGRPITATSANVSGHGAPYVVKEIVEQFSKSGIKPDLIINGGILKKNKPSTIVDLSGPRVRMLRKGPISFKEIQKACASTK